MSRNNVICVTGIDTDIGKTIATGLLGRYLLGKGYSVITQKISQTGCTGLSEDILQHRSIMGIEIQKEDREGITCPYIFPEPCSPHLAASLVDKEIKSSVIRQATHSLMKSYDYVLLEGVGGLLVPLNSDATLLDYLEKEGYPLILVSSPRLGSINHTLAALELAHIRGLEVVGILYNRFSDTNELIAEDSIRVFKKYLLKYGFQDRVINLYGLEEYEAGNKDLNFQSLFDDFK